MRRADWSGGKRCKRHVGSRLFLRYGHSKEDARRRLGREYKSDVDGWPPLMTAVFSPGHLNSEAALLLIRYGADVNFRDKDGDAPLYFAADGGRYPEMDPQSPAVVKALLDKGARINAQNKDGSTPLMFASFRLRPVLVRLLLQHGANVNMRSKNGSTAISDAQKDNPYKETHDGCQPVVIRLLKAAGTMR